MACNANDTLAAACTSGIGKLNSRVQILQVLAQNLCSASLAPPDPYDGLLVYTRQGLGTTTVVGPVGAYNLTFGANKVTEIHCHNCPLITGITCTTDALLTVLDVENLPSIANLRFSNCTALTSVNLDTFTAVSGDVDFLSCTSLTSFSASSLVSVGGNLFLTGCGLTSLSLPSLQFVASFSCGQLPLTTLSLPALQSVSIYIYFALNNALTEITLPSLQSCGGIIYTNNCALVQSVNLPSLQIVSDFLLDGLPSVTSVSVPLLEEIQNSLGLLGSINLIDFLMPSYAAALPSIVDASNCTSLSQFSYNAQFTVDGGTYNFTGCALDINSVNSLIQSLTDAGNTSTFLDTSGGFSSAPDAAHALQVIQLNIDGNNVTTN